ncbi:MAG: hypothetical protein K2X45_09395 [Phreatobacter sp.]|nr:hypothetical protein [Phreatobacter sp.]
MITILALVAGLATAFAAGVASGLQIGREALGAELAAYMGGLYGMISGGAAVVVTVLVLSFV